MKGDAAHSCLPRTWRFALSAFLLMMGYGILRPLANSLFSEYLGAERMFWGMAAVPLVVAALIWPWGRLLSILGPRHSMRLWLLVSVILIILPSLHPGRAMVFFLFVWKEVYIVLLLEQFWALANSSFSQTQGKKSYGLLLVAGGLGASMGNLTVGALVQYLGTWPMLFLVPLGLLLFWLVLATLYTGQSSNTDSAHTKPTAGHSGIGLLFTSRIMLAMGLIVGLGQIMAAALDVYFHVQLQAAVPDLDTRTAREAMFWFGINTGSLGLSLLSPLLFSNLSLKLIHSLIPLTHVAMGVIACLYPGYGTAALAFACFKLLDYSWFRMAKELVYIPLDFEARYRAKMFLDMTVYRTSKGLGAIFLSLLAITSLLPLISALGAVVWLVVVPMLCQKTLGTEEEKTSGTEEGLL